MICLVSTKKIRDYLRSAPYLPPLMSVFLIYLILLYLLTLTPFHFSKFFFRQFFHFHHGYLAAFIGGASPGDIFLNLVMLLPFGLVVGTMLRFYSKPKKSAILFAMATGLLLSFTIEFCQLFLPRTSSGVDLIANAIGAGGSAWLAYPLGRFDLLVSIQNLYHQNPMFYFRVVALYVLLATLILLLPISINTFRNWDNNYQLFIGNEATQNRPWRGTIYQLLIFDRVLPAHVIQKIFHDGFRHHPVALSESDLLLGYSFTNSLSKSISSSNDSLPLIASQPLQSEQFGNNGLQLSNKIYLNSLVPATNLVERAQRTNQITIAVWIKPENLRQRGPARIISLSKDTDHRNFTLAQSGAMLTFRVRTPLTGLNGSEVELTTQPALTLDTPQFVVATFHRGEYQLYVNGTRAAPMIYSTSYYLPLLIDLGKHKFGKFSFCFALFFPLGWIARGLAQRKSWKSISSAIVVMIPFLILSSLTSVLLQHRIDLHLFLICATTACLVFLIGLIYDFTWRHI